MTVEFDDGTAHYQNAELDDMGDVRECIEGECDELNWLFVGTSGVHGSYAKLDEYPDIDTFTVLIVRPRLVSMIFGHIEIEKHTDVKYLHERVNETVDVIQEVHGGGRSDE